MKARYLAEAICKQIYRLEGLEKGAKPADKMMLNDLIGAFKKHSVLDGMLLLNIEIIQRVGNFGAHDQGLATGNLTADEVAQLYTAFARPAEAGASVPAQKRWAAGAARGPGPSPRRSWPRDLAPGAGRRRSARSAARSR